MQTHNRHVDTVRQHAKAAAHPTTLTPAELDAAFALASSARALLHEAYKLLRPDYSLSLHCETAGKCAKDLMEAVVARMPPADPKPGRAH